MGNEEVKIVIEHMELRSAHQITFFLKHYEKKKAITARHAGNSIFGIDDSLGFLPVDEALNLYNALVDPHLSTYTWSRCMHRRCTNAPFKIRMYTTLFCATPSGPSN
jgi:hypothetical protein